MDDSSAMATPEKPTSEGAINRREANVAMVYFDMSGSELQDAWSGTAMSPLAFQRQRLPPL
jgi:hypothetical protein